MYLIAFDGIEENQNILFKFSLIKYITLLNKFHYLSK